MINLNYPYLEQIYMITKMFEPFMLNCKYAKKKKKKKKKKKNNKKTKQKTTTKH